MNIARRRIFHWLALALLAVAALLYASSSANADELKWRIGSYMAVFDANDAYFDIVATYTLPKQ